jgi:hypothetical protein
MTNVRENQEWENLKTGKQQNPKRISNHRTTKPRVLGGDRKSAITSAVPRQETVTEILSRFGLGWDIKII